nr:hypothetical protein [Tanacetum cinerariifolium]
MGHFARECRAPRNQERVRKESYGQRSKAEEKSSKALMANDGVGWDWSYMANEEDHALVSDGETPTEFALMANNENRHSYKLRIDQLEDRLAEYKEREVKYIETIRSLERDKECNLKDINKLTSDVETLQDGKDLVDGKPSPSVASTSAEDQHNDTSTSE